MAFFVGPQSEGKNSEMQKGLFAAANGNLE